MTSAPPPGLSKPDSPPRPLERAALHPAAGAAAWPAWTAWVAIASGLGATILASIVVAFAIDPSGRSKDDLSSPAVNVGLTIFQDLALVGAALLFAGIASRPRAPDFGLRRPPLGPAIGLVVATWLGFLAFAAAWSALLSLHERTDLPEKLGADTSTLSLVGVTILVTVLVPVCEELFFRGYFFGALRNWRGLWPAAILTGLVFGGVHAGSAPAGQLVPLAALGVGLCVLYHVSGSLYPCIAVHALNNSIAFGATQHWSWEIVLVIVGAVTAALTLASLLARALGTRPAPAARVAAA